MSNNAIEIVAIVQGTNVIPNGWPENHPLYFRDTNSWVYLSDEGEKVYKANKEEVDMLIKTIYEPKVKQWAKNTIAQLLSS